MVTIHKNQNLHFYNGLEEGIVNLINQKKIKSHILVGVREGNMRSEIKKMIFSMRVNGALESDYKIMVMEGIESVLPISDELILWYKKHEHEANEKDRIDYSKRDFLMPTAEGNVVIEYIKPKIGRNGRNCKGEQIGRA